MKVDAFKVIECSGYDRIPGWGVMMTRTSVLPATNIHTLYDVVYTDPNG